MSSSSTSRSSSDKRRVVICGAGIIGSSIAYHLSLRKCACVVLERQSQPASCASGKAGGFLAEDWCDDPAADDGIGPLGSMARRSFALHMELRQRFGEDCDYRLLDAFQLNNGSRSRIGSSAAHAQVHPYKLTCRLLSEALALGAELQLNTQVTGLLTDGQDGPVRGVRAIQSGLGTEIYGSHVVVALGPWSTALQQWLSELFPKLAPPRSLELRSVKYHSLVATVEGLAPEALFLEEEDVEFYPRVRDELYVCGAQSGAAVPEDPAAVEPELECSARLESVMREMLPEAKVRTRQACYVPTAARRSGLPVIGEVREGLLAAFGHSCWGILNAPATGEAVADIILKGIQARPELRPFFP